jgi:transposase
MMELSEAEQRYQAVMAVIGDGLSISQVAEKVGVSRQTLHAWLARYGIEGLEGLTTNTPKLLTRSSPTQLPTR